MTHSFPPRGPSDLKFQAQIGSIMNSFVIHWPDYVIGQIEGVFRALVGADSLNGPLCIIPPNRSETALLALVYASELVSVEVLNRGPACKRSEGHTSELQSLMPISYAVFCLK